ncbi:Von Willebrand Factor A Domain-Containing Protein 8 [Manis pentadactyla]|nr:Von Willebrand Factor A Domain-Containing Protein 8 [Manis pentadactyla]
MVLLFMSRVNILSVKSLVQSLPRGTEEKALWVRQMVVVKQITHRVHVRIRKTNSVKSQTVVNEWNLEASEDGSVRKRVHKVNGQDRATPGNGLPSPDTVKTWMNGSGDGWEGYSAAMAELFGESLWELRRRSLLSTHIPFSHPAFVADLAGKAICSCRKKPHTTALTSPILAGIESSLQLR